MVLEDAAKLPRAISEGWGWGEVAALQKLSCESGEAGGGEACPLFFFPSFLSRWEGSGQLAVLGEAALGERA